MPTRLPLTAIRTDGGTQSRAEIDRHIVNEYAQAMIDGAEFPPVVLFYDGATYWLADGFHRIEAAKVACWKEIDVDIRQGTQRDAILHSVGANDTHGLRRTNADKRRAVEVLLNDGEWGKWSNCEIARICSVSESFVRTLRPHFVSNEVTGSSLATDASNDGDPVTCDQVTSERTYTTKHGTVATMQTANIGRTFVDTQGDEKLREKIPERNDDDLREKIPQGTDDDLGPNFGLGTTDESSDYVAASTSRPHFAHNSGDNEWYTPVAYLDAARAVLGRIDLDPASSAEANTLVRAETYYTAEDNGLRQDWSGTVWMNPPYASDLIGPFIDKLGRHFAEGDLDAAIVLVNNATETRWCQALFAAASAVCFPAGRVKFWHPRKEAMPLQGQAIFYLGHEADAFAAEFSLFGAICYVTE